MRILLLIMLAVIGLTQARWLGEPPLADSTTAPAAPTRPQELIPFEQDLNRFLRDAATQRGRQADPP